MANQRMTQTQLVRSVAESCEVPNKTARLFLDNLGSLAIAEVKKNGVFVVPGLGRLALISYQAQDLVLMQSVVLYAALLGIAASFLVDMLVAALDPDVRVEWRFVARPKYGRAPPRVQNYSSASPRPAHL